MDVAVMKNRMNKKADQPIFPTKEETVGLPLENVFSLIIFQIIGK